MDTVVRSRSKTVVIGPEQPFCVIGERINPTGRKVFQAQLQAGDLSQLDTDVAQQVEGGADMLDVNVGDPLADEVALMGQAIPLVQQLTDIPLCIDSSVIEALEAGLEAYEGKALVNSVTGEDERLEAILPIVAKYGAAVIGLANAEDIPMEASRRVEIAKKIVARAGEHGIPPEDVIIDPLAMPIGAEPRAVTLFLETLHLLHDELGVNTTCGAGNTSFGLPGTPHARRGVPRGRAESRPDERDHGFAPPGDGRGRPRDRLPARPRRVGRDLDPHVPRETGGSDHVSALEDLPEEPPHSDRVRLRFLQSGEDRAVKEARVLAGTTIFDAASWNGVAIDSTCGGHGTCKKCKVKVISGHAPISSVDPRAFTIEELKNGWRLACRANTAEDLTIEVPPLQTRPKAALVGVGRHVILRPAVQKRYVELDEATLTDQKSDLERLLAAMDDVEPRVPLDIVRELGGTLRRANWKVTAVLADDLLIDVEEGDTSGSRHAIAFDLGTTTVVATLLDLETGQPKAVQSILNAQQPFGADVISRISAIMMDDGALDMLRTHAHETLQQLTDEVCAEGGVDPAEVYEVVVAGNQTMIQIALGIDPEPLSMAPFTVVARRMPAATAADFGVTVHPRAPAVMFPALGAYVGPDIVAGILATGHHARPPRAALHRRRHELGDRARLLGEDARDRGSRRAGLRGGADPLRHARRRGRDRGREDRRRRRAADRDRRRRGGRPLRLRARRRRCRAHRRGHARSVLAALSRALRIASPRSARRTSSTSPTTSTSRSATCASSSSRRRRSRRAGGSSAATSASSPRRSRRCCSAARSARTSAPRAR